MTRRAHRLRRQHRRCDGRVKLSLTSGQARGRSASTRCFSLLDWMLPPSRLPLRLATDEPLELRITSDSVSVAAGFASVRSHDLKGVAGPAVPFSDSRKSHSVDGRLIVAVRLEGRIV